MVKLAKCAIYFYFRLLFDFLLLAQGNADNNEITIMRFGNEIMNYAFTINYVLCM